ncbi:MAG TPA: transcription elongation factor GreA [Solirubrobacteraceae bacterium]
MTEANVITAEGLSALNAELEELEGPSRREIAERIKTAREWGDLKENSEYHDAKNDQSHLERKIAMLRERISRSEIIEPEATGTGTDGVVSFGSTVVVADEAGGEQTWTLVSSHEAAPKEGRLSIESPVAKALTGRRAGDTTTIALPRGARTLRIVSVT